MNLKFAKRILSCGLSLLLLFAVLPAAYGQGKSGTVREKGLSLSVRNESLPSTLAKLKEISGCNFLYDQRVADQAPAITLNESNVSLTTILDRISRITNLSYARVDNTVTFAAKPVATAAADSKRTVTGVVKDTKGNPMVGASVIEQGTSNGVITNASGEYSIRVSGGSLVASFIGYKDAVEPVGTRTFIEITLSENAEYLEEVVVVGYGSQRRATVTGAVTTVQSEALSVVPIASTTNALTGRIPGLITVQESGQPGADAASLSIRGFGDALVIVDGVESSFNNIDANEIESISVLKDGSAAIYGARAGNGVILVTTKRGKIGRPQITLNTSWSFQTATNTVKRLGSGDYTTYERERYINAGGNPETAPYTEEQIAKYYAGNDPDYPSTDWYNEIIRNYAPAQQHNLSLRGGNEIIQYYGFVGYLNQETIVKNGGGNYERFNVRSNIDAKILDNLKMSVDMSAIIESRKNPYVPIGYNSENSNLWGLLDQTLPTYSASLPDESKIPYAGLATYGGAHVASNRGLVGTNDTFTDNIRLQGTLQYDVKEVPGLSAKASFTYNKILSHNKKFQRPFKTYRYLYSGEEYIEYQGWPNPSLLESRSEWQELTGQAYLTYERVFGEKHSFKAMVVGEFIDTKASDLGGSREGYYTDKIPYLNFGSVNNMTSSGGASEDGRASLLGRINYSYADKYMIEGILRYDATAQLPKGSRGGYFPSVSAAWRMSEEPFLKDHAKWLSNLKIRASWGQSGYDKFFAASMPFPYYGEYVQGNGYVIGGNTEQTFYMPVLPNERLTWETMTTYNAGLDFSFFGNSLYGEADAFYQLRDGIIGNRGAGTSDTFGIQMPSENLNSLSTRGFEFSLGYRNEFKVGGRPFQLDVKGNVSWSRAKYEDWFEPTYEKAEDRRLKQLSGNWTDRTFVYKTDGLFTSLRDIAEYPAVYKNLSQGNSGLKKGDLRIVDVDGNGEINEYDMVEVRGPVPHWMLGLDMTFSHRGFSLYLQFQGALGAYKNISSVIGANDVTFENRWTEENNRPRALFPRLGGQTAIYNASSDYFIKSSDYLRLKNLSFSYDFPKRWMSKVRIENLRLFFTATNLFTLSHLNRYNIDPEAPTNHSIYYYPQMRTFTLGLNITL